MKTTKAHYPVGLILIGRPKKKDIYSVQLKKEKKIHKIDSGYHRYDVRKWSWLFVHQNTGLFFLFFSFLLFLHPAIGKKFHVFRPHQALTSRHSPLVRPPFWNRLAVIAAHHLSHSSLLFSLASMSIGSMPSIIWITVRRAVRRIENCSAVRGLRVRPGSLVCPSRSHRSSPSGIAIRRLSTFFKRSTSALNERPIVAHGRAESLRLSNAASTQEL